MKKGTFIPHHTEQNYWRKKVGIIKIFPEGNARSVSTSTADK